jgi:hypothetical protein
MSLIVGTPLKMHDTFVKIPPPPDTREYFHFIMLWQQFLASLDIKEDRFLSAVPWGCDCPEQLFLGGRDFDSTQSILFSLLYYK